MIFNISAEWSVCGSMQIEAKSKAEAIATAMRKPLPDGDYIPDSFTATNAELLSATPIELLEALLSSEEVFVASEVGDEITEVIEELAGGNNDKAVELLEAILESDELAVESPVGDEVIAVLDKLKAD